MLWHWDGINEIPTRSGHQAILTGPLLDASRSPLYGLVIYNHDINIIMDEFNLC